MSDDEPFKRATDAALRLLSYRPRSEAEVRGRLLPRFPSKVVEEVVSRLKEQDLLGDAAFSRFWRNSRDALNPRSAFLIRQELISKGVDRETAREALQDIDDQENAYKAALRAARRFKQADPSAFRRKLWGYLQRRGFSASVISQTTKRLLEETKKDGLV